jgi:Arc/MetJ family transcription regulator
MVIDLDDDLIADVSEVLGTRTTMETINAALREVLEYRQRALAPGEPQLREKHR